MFSTHQNTAVQEGPGRFRKVSRKAFRKGFSRNSCFLESYWRKGPPYKFLCSVPEVFRKQNGRVSVRQIEKKCKSGPRAVFGCSPLLPPPPLLLPPSCSSLPFLPTSSLLSPLLHPSLLSCSLISPLSPPSSSLCRPSPLPPFLPLRISGPFFYPFPPGRKGTCLSTFN